MRSFRKRSKKKQSYFLCLKVFSLSLSLSLSTTPRLPAINIFPLLFCVFWCFLQSIGRLWGLTLHFFIFHHFYFAFFHILILYYIFSPCQYSILYCIFLFLHLHLFFRKKRWIAYLYNSSFHFSIINLYFINSSCFCILFLIFILNFLFVL